MATQESVKAALDGEQRRVHADLDNRFSYHAPKEGQTEIYERIRAEGKGLAKLLVCVCPKSRELSIALTKTEEVVMWANASIARNT